MMPQRAAPLPPSRRMLEVEVAPGAEFECLNCRKTMLAPTATWSNNFVCTCGQEYKRVSPMASQADLDHLFGAKPSPYDEFGSF